MSDDIDDHCPCDSPRSLPPARVRVRRPEVPAPAPAAPAPETQPEPAPALPAAPAPELPADDYEVGYRRPPKSHQFQPGRSGNPKGRPKGSRSLSTLVDEALSRTIKANIGGKTVLISQREAMVRQYVDKAMRGDLKAFAVLLKLDPKAKQAEAGPNEAEANLTAEEQAMLAAFLARDIGEPEDES